MRVAGKVVLLFSVAALAKRIAAFHWVAQHNGFVGQGLKLAQTVSGSVVDRKDRAYCLSMKIFDWKRRQDDSYRLVTPEHHKPSRGPDSYAVCPYLGLAEKYGITPHTIFPAPGSRHRKKRKGRGISAGQGASCGFGMRGQKSRSGPGPKRMFEGGQTPITRRLPKYVGRPMGPGHKKKEYALIKLEHLTAVPEGSLVNFNVLKELKVVQKTNKKRIKVLGNSINNIGDAIVVKGLTVQAHAFSKTAKEVIEANGGTCQLLSYPSGRPVDELPPKIRGGGRDWKNWVPDVKDKPILA